MFERRQRHAKRLTIRELLTSYFIKEGAMRTQRLFVDKPTAILEGLAKAEHV
jgi:hypothetical protein